MLDIDWIGQTILLEVAGVSVAVGFFVIFMRLRAHNRDKRAAHALANKIRDEQNARRKEVEQVVEKIIHEDKAKAEELVAVIVRAEHDLYQAFLDSYIIRTQDSVVKLHDNVSAFSDSYKTLIGNAKLDAKEDKTPPGPTLEEHNALKTEISQKAAQIEKMQSELGFSNKTLNDLFREYSAMFGAGANVDQNFSAKEISEKIESGELG